MAPKLEEKARTGRDNQRYGAQGERLVAGVVPLSADKKKVLLIQSTRRNGWVVPKGGWETDEQTAEDAACREAWEEAGIHCKIQKDLGKIPDRRGPEELTAQAPRAVFQFFEVTVEKEEAKWPEMHKRDRKWMSYTEAKLALAARPELLEALNRSSIRHSDGIKLGQVLFKDLIKRIPPALGSKAALRDPVVELDVSCKTLTDTGFRELAKGLIQTYNADGGQSNILRLEELNLKSNGLSPVSLHLLSEIVRLACNDIRDLDLSSNDIHIVSSEDIIAWEAFLRAISSCSVLRRLDLSNNALGPKAFEILSKVHGQEESIDFAVPSELVDHASYGTSRLGSISEKVSALEHKARKWSIGAEDDETNRNGVNHGKGLKPSRHASKVQEKAGNISQEFHHLPIYRSTKGLRAIPYIILSETSIDDTSALHLSYVLMSHHYPQKLLPYVPPVKPGPMTHQLTAHDSETRCRGIIYLPNSRCSNAAFKALDLAERAREILHCVHGLEDSTEEDARSMEKEVGADSNFTLPSPNGHRRWSSAATDSEGKETVEVELHRARSRLQLNAIENEGLRSNDLWLAACKMLALSRMMHPTVTKAPSPPVPPVTPAPKPRLSIVKILDIPAVPPKESNPWGLPLTPKSVNMSMSPRAKPRKQSVAAISSTNIPTAAHLTRPIDQRLSLTNKTYRSNLPLGFSSDIWWRILGYAVDSHGLLSSKQQKAVLQYAIDRGSLRKERQALGLKAAAQKWHVLEDVDCLAYEVR